MHLEFFVLGPPVSNQSSGPNLSNWRVILEREAKRNWNHPTLIDNLKAVIINFHDGDKPSVDVDNMSKPILDVMESIVYENDRQIRQVEISHVRIAAPFVIAGVSSLLVSAIQAGKPFVYVRIEDPVEPFLLPK